MRKQAGISMGMVICIAAILMILFTGFIFPMGGHTKKSAMKAAAAQNNRQIALAAIMYGADHNDWMPPTINGWLSRMQNVGDDELTLDCPSIGTQDFPAKSAGARRTDAWPLLLYPYLKARHSHIEPWQLLGRLQTEFDSPIFSGEPQPASSLTYHPDRATYRNQNRFPAFGLNYMFLSPLRIPKDKRGLADAINYTVAEAHKFTEANDPSATIFFAETQYSPKDPNRGFFVVNAPGMWPVFAESKNGYVAFWRGTLGSGDWVGTETACNENESPCQNPNTSVGFVYTRLNTGSNVTFLDGHVKYMKPERLAQGTDYQTAVAGSQGHLGSGARIIDKTKYLWNLSDANFYGL